MRLVATREDYFEAALDRLAREGHTALTTGALCRSLGVTTGSFYHYFDGYDAFVAELLGYWERTKTKRLAEAARAEPDPSARVLALKRAALDLPHAAEAAIRAWAHVNPAVADVQQRVDRERQRALRSAIGAVIGRGRRADRLAAVGMSLLIGQQQWRTPVDVRELAQLLDEYEAMIIAAAG